MRSAHIRPVFFPEFHVALAISKALLPDSKTDAIGLVELDFSCEVEHVSRELVRWVEVSYIHTMGDLHSRRRIEVLEALVALGVDFSTLKLLNMSSFNSSYFYKSFNCLPTSELKFGVWNRRMK